MWSWRMDWQQAWPFPSSQTSRRVIIASWFAVATSRGGSSLGHQLAANLPVVLFLSVVPSRHVLPANVRPLFLLLSSSNNNVLLSFLFQPKFIGLPRAKGTLFNSRGRGTDDFTWSRFQFRENGNKKSIHFSTSSCSFWLQRNKDRPQISTPVVILQLPRNPIRTV